MRIDRPPRRLDYRSRSSGGTGHRSHLALERGNARMSPRKASAEEAYEEIQAEATDWAEREGFDPWRSALNYVKKFCDRWAGPDATRGARAAQYGALKSRRNHARILVVSGLVPSLTGILVAYLQIGYAKDESIKWILTSASSLIGAFVALFETLGGTSEKELSGEWQGLFDKLLKSGDRP
jgi:hypothetical protein